jgi:RHS repeat-associated protein
MQPKLEIIWSQLPRTVYFLKDHLGSIRASVQDTATATVVGYDDYDPWGYILTGRSMIASGWGSQAGIIKNKFTGKEWDDEFGVNWNYFGARYYDPLIGRWMVVDPLAAKHPDFTPYNYVLNNPLRLIDPDGKQVDIHEVRFHRDLTLRQQGFSEQEIKEIQQADARVDLVGAGILVGGLAAFTAGPYVTAALLSNPVTTNEIGIAITEALLPGAESSTVGAVSKIIEPGTLSNVEARKFYHQLLDAIPSKIDQSLPLKERALQAFELRHQAKVQAREAMADREAVKQLRPIQSLRDLVRKAYREGKEETKFGNTF